MISMTYLAISIISKNFNVKIRVTRQLYKKLPNFQIIAQKVTKSKRPKYLQQSSIWKPKTSTSNHLKILKYLQQTMFWNCLFRWKCNKFAEIKSSPKNCHYFGLLHLFKKSQWASKSNPTGKKLPNLVTLIKMNYFPPQKVKIQSLPGTLQKSIIAFNGTTYCGLGSVIPSLILHPSWGQIL